MYHLPEFENQKTILIASLNWGLGHATRLIPIVKHYKKSHRIILAGNKPSLTILTDTFPDLEVVELQGQSFFFDSRFFSPANLFRFFRQLNLSIRNDNKKTKDIIHQFKIDIIISDNRYGLWNKDTYNILITHQLMLKLPKPWAIFQKPIHNKILRKIKNFDECWVPDFLDKKNLSGDLSHKYSFPENIKFIGPLSRFQKNLLTEKETKKVLVILSGPEPQRTEFEIKLQSFFVKNKISATMLLGKPNAVKSIENNLISKIPHTTDNKFVDLVKNHSIIIARAGYSTIMDFHFLQKPIILVPTPKQTEQIYLAKHLKNHPLFSFVDEKEIENYLTKKLL